MLKYDVQTILLDVSVSFILYTIKSFQHEQIVNYLRHLFKLWMLFQLKMFIS